MSLITFIIITGAAGLGGIVVGYFLRWLVTLGQKGSMELTIKQQLLEAKEEAQKIVASAETEATTILQEVKVQEKEKETQLKKLEDRLLNKDEILDKRQVDIDKEAEALKQRAEELKKIKSNGSGVPRVIRTMS